MVGKSINWEIRILSLYRADYSKGFYARQMAELLGTSHVTLLPHLKKLEKNKILVSKTAGRNLEYRLNFENLIAKEKLISAEKFEAVEFFQKNFLIKKITEQIAPLNLSGSLVLFGSHAKGYATEKSDIDIFYLGELKESERKGIKKMGKIYGKEINIKSASVKNFGSGLKEGDALIKEIIKAHVIIQNPDLFVNMLWGYYGKR